MSHHRTSAVLTAGFLAAGLALAGCSSDEPDESDASTTAVTSGATADAATVTSPPDVATTPTPSVTSEPTTEPATTVPATTVPATTEALAPATEAELTATALLTIEDVPNDWIEIPDDGSADDDELITLVAECAGIDVALVSSDVLGDSRSKSGDFTNPDETAALSHTVGFAADEVTAIEAITQFADPDLAACYSSSVTKLLNELIGTQPATTDPEAATTLGTVLAERRDTSAFGSDDEVIGYSVVIPITSDGQTTEQYIDVIFVRSGRVLSQVAFNGNDAPFPEDTLATLVETAIERSASIA